MGTDPAQCCSNCCPEAVDVTIEETNVYVEGGQVEITVPTITDPTAAIDIAMQVVDDEGDDLAGRYLIKWWLVDSYDPTANVSPSVPTTPGASQGQRVTESDGSLTLTLRNTGALHTCYLCAEVFGVVSITAAISLGT